MGMVALLVGKVRRDAWSWRSRDVCQSIISFLLSLLRLVAPAHLFHLSSCSPPTIFPIQRRQPPASHTSSPTGHDRGMVRRAHELGILFSGWW